MKIVVAMDSFKGSMTSMEAGNAVREGILEVLPKAEVVVRPVADGGEGTVEAMVSAWRGELVQCLITGPNGSKVTAAYGVCAEKRQHNRNCAGSRFDADAGEESMESHKLWNR